MIPKFRAWDKENKCWTNYAIIDDMQRFYDKHIGDWLCENKDWFVLMQSTGVRDKNGVEIYEGDIVTNCIEDVTGFVYFDAKQLQIVISGKNKNWYMCGNNTFRNCEVIGNIYENPDIMKN